MKSSKKCIKAATQSGDDQCMVSTLTCCLRSNTQRVCLVLPANIIELQPLQNFSCGYLKKSKKERRDRKSLIKTTTKQRMREESKM
eukprot:scaffold31646_cov19-Prasinocladus_malaysianus.AAC.1